MEKKLAEYKCETNDAISLKLGKFTASSVTHPVCRMFVIFTCVFLNLGFCVYIPSKVIAFFLQFAFQRM